MAVNSEQFPATRQFFERLPDEIKSDRLFQHIIAYLKIGNADRQIDIEEVLWELKLLSAFASDSVSGQGLVGYSLANSRLLDVTGHTSPAYNLGHLGQILSALQSQCKILTDQINATVYEFYGQEPSASDVKGNWSYLLQRMKQIGWAYDIFTTNYDVAIETAVTLDGTLNSDQFFGLRNVQHKQLDIARWENPVDGGSLLTKLHGSINWQWGQERIFVGAPVFTGNHENHAIIYPGFKGESQSPFFSPLHNYFAQRLSEARILIFIGFAFRDEYINRLISENIEPTAKIVVIDPCEKINFPIRRKRPVHVSQGFDKIGIDAALAVKLPTRMKLV